VEAPLVINALYSSSGHLSALLSRLAAVSSDVYDRYPPYMRHEMTGVRSDRLFLLTAPQSLGDPPVSRAQAPNIREEMPCFLSHNLPVAVFLSGPNV
jgi:hypothetical protein